MPKNILVISRQRSGSTAVLELLCSHPKIQNFGELLNPNEDPNVPKDGEGIYDYLNKKLSQPPELASLSNGWPSEYCAFKIHIHEKDEQNFKWDYLIRYCKVETIIVVWRKEIVETIVSVEIARITDEWYSMKETSKIHSVSITEDFLKSSINSDLKNWADVFESWPIEIRPIFIQYEELFSDSNSSNNAIIAERFQKVFQEIGIEGHEFVECYSKKQNPAPIDQKIKNWFTLPKELREQKINVPAMFEEIISKKFGLPKEIVTSMVPDREPLPPCGGFKYRVAEPFIPKEVFNNVNDALKTGNISSASSWPKELSNKLCSFFDSQVAIPCANGFIALVLALQSSNISQNDEVIIPSLTMIAVPNAVKFN
uniref:Sulfotransferase n=1 Tax=Panagrolaimus davidi TaxID=227884 RepID=A0A914QQT4_9BILA